MDNFVDWLNNITNKYQINIGDTVKLIDKRVVKQNYPEILLRDDLNTIYKHYNKNLTVKEIMYNYIVLNEIDITIPINIVKKAGIKNIQFSNICNP
jgi:hypothetical protein